MEIELQIHDILIYLAADLDVVITSDRRKVWLDQFGKEDAQQLWAAARLLTARKIYTRFPRCADLWAALEELYGNDEEDWGVAWDLWVQIARRHGAYRIANAIEEFERESPLGARALGTMAKEYFSMKTEDMNTFRAQFRQRYESMVTREKLARTRPANLRVGYDGKPLMQLVSVTANKLDAKSKKKIAGLKM